VPDRAERRGGGQHDACTPSGGLPSPACNARLQREAALIARDPRQSRQRRIVARAAVIAVDEEGWRPVLGEGRAQGGGGPLDAACARHDACTPSGGLPSPACNARLQREAALIGTVCPIVRSAGAEATRERAGIMPAAKATKPAASRRSDE
jgi:hypothetical protein